MVKWDRLRRGWLGLSLGLVASGVPTSVRAASSRAPNPNNRAEYLAHIVGNEKVSLEGRDWALAQSHSLRIPQYLVFLRGVASIGPLSHGAISVADTSFEFTEDYATNAMKELLRRDDESSFVLIRQRVPYLALSNQAELLQIMLYKGFFDLKPLHLFLAQNYLRQILGLSPEQLGSTAVSDLGCGVEVAALILANGDVIKGRQDDENRALIHAALRQFPAYTSLLFAAILTGPVTEPELNTAQQLFSDPETDTFSKEDFAIALAPTHPQAAHWYIGKIESLLEQDKADANKNAHRLAKMFSEPYCNSRLQSIQIMFVDSRFVGHLRFFLHPDAERLTFECLGAHKPEIRQQALFVAAERFPARCLATVERQQAVFNQTPDESQATTNALVLLAEEHPQYEARVKFLLPDYEAKCNQLRQRGFDDILLNGHNFHSYNFMGSPGYVGKP